MAKDCKKPPAVEQRVGTDEASWCARFAGSRWSLASPLNPVFDGPSLSGKQMGIIRTVVEVAEILERSGLAVGPKQRAATGLLRTIPLFSEAAKIELWERSIGELLPDEPWKPADLVIDRTFAFAQFNFYGALNPVGTEACFRELEKAMRGAGLPMPSAPDFSQW